MAFENGFPDMHYYLNVETGDVPMVTDETRSELEKIYEELDGEDLDDLAVLADAIQQRQLPDWMKEALHEADRVESGYGTRYITIPRDETHDAYRDMGEFILTVRSKRLQERLWEAISGRGAFSRFKSVLSAQPEERERWFAFKDARVRERIIEWLESEGIELATE